MLKDKIIGATVGAVVLLLAAPGVALADTIEDAPVETPVVEEVAPPVVEEEIVVDAPVEEIPAPVVEADPAPVVAEAAPVAEAVIDETPWILAGWALPGDVTDPVFPGQTLVTSTDLSVADLSALDSVMVGACFDGQVDLYWDTPESRALLASGRLDGSHQDGHLLAHGSVPGNPYKLIDNDPCAEVILPKCDTVTGSQTLTGDGVLSVEGGWAEAQITVPFNGTLADLGTVFDLTASDTKYLGLHVDTPQGTIVFEEDPSYGGTLWSKTAWAGVPTTYYAAQGTIQQYVAVNGNVPVNGIRLVYTSDVASTTTVESFTIGCTLYTFAPEMSVVVPVAPVVVQTTGECVDEEWVQNTATVTLPDVDGGRWLEYGAGPVVFDIAPGEYTFGFITAEGNYTLGAGGDYQENGVAYFTITIAGLDAEDCVIPTVDVPTVDVPTVEEAPVVLAASAPIAGTLAETGADVGMRVGLLTGGGILAAVGLTLALIARRNTRGGAVRTPNE